MVVGAQPIFPPEVGYSDQVSKDEAEQNLVLIPPLTEKYPTKVPVEKMMIASPAIFETADEAVKACAKAQSIYSISSLKMRKQVIQSIRQECSAYLEDFALCALCETRRGRYDHKLIKQHIAVRDTPGVEELQPKVFSGDNGATIIDYAPFGVIGAITPFTNPTATVINNSITILAGGNGVVFNPHPSAAVCTARVIGVIHNAIVRAGGPPYLVGCIKTPTTETGAALLTHPLVAANLVTGGPAIVKQALLCGKRSFCAGPGNPPVVVDDTADLRLAAESIYKGASFDNGMICANEKEVFVLESVADKLMEEFKNVGAYVADADQTAALLQLIFPHGLPPPYKRGTINRETVGADATTLLQRIGVTDFAPGCQLIVTEVKEDHALVWTEQLTTLLPIVRVPTFEKALELAKAAEYGFKHTSSLYSQDISAISRMGRYMSTSIFVSNGPHFSGLGVGGEGPVSFSIAGYTGEGLTRPSTFVREKKLVCLNNLRIV
eukprot:Blabericola_migrator_1__825@NODE_1202_length_5123_cov_39_383900_g814_i0_p2_GENE_NODE_1202_length_5123_cov_39_383900_g814_i0NODE_1202_length_5123_cov_39_383900_g814_i0_p2_ORF_typecomplete_len494_score71_23Aldedh/PF00171_22/5_4e54_NODE_1202_length_5123_cov_39_383900_g814_i014092890